MQPSGIQDKFITLCYVALHTGYLAQIQAIEEALNNRPRKSLGWFTPSQVMANFYTVALAA